MALSRKRKIIIASAALVVLILIIFISIFASRKDEPEVTVIKVDLRQELRSTVTASGEVRPIRFINLTSEVAGRIEEIYVNPGDPVTAGQPLVRLDPTQLQSNQDAQLAAVQASISDVQNARAQLAQTQQALTVSEVSIQQARQQLQSSQTSVDRAQVDLRTAERELKRTTELVESGVASRSEYDAARDRYEQAVVGLRTAQANLNVQKEGVNEAIARANQQRKAVAAAQAGINSSESRANQQQAILRGQTSQRDKTLQRATIPGVVADIPAKVGQFAVANLQSTPLMTIADMSTINIEVNVDETEIASVEVGQPVKVKVDAMGEREIEGAVIQKNPLAVGKSDTTGGGISNRVNVQEAKEFKVIVELRNMPDEVRAALKPGMTATATITTKVKQNVIAVPLQAIIEKAPTPQPTPAAQGSVPQPTPANKPKDIKGVYILQGNRVKFVEVTTGITGESDIEITSGVQQGMEVITGPSRILKTLKDNATVKRQTTKPGAAANSNEAK